MKFYYKPKEAIVQNIKEKQTGSIKRHLVCVFDGNGELETEDEKVMFVLQNKLPGCTWDEGKIITKEEAKSILDDKEIRELAKDKGIKHWHNKSIDRLKTELSE